jgi:hypothetical protein
VGVCLLGLCDSASASYAKTIDRLYYRDVGRDSVVRIAAGLYGDRIPVGATFFAPVQTGPGAHPASCTMGTGSLSRRLSSRGAALTTDPHLAPRLKKE